MMPVRKAVFPVAGLGTRFLPATKSVPKEMMTVVDKPLVQYAVEEAQSAGIEQFIFVTSSYKTAISDHLGTSSELEKFLEDGGNSSLLASVRGCQLPSTAVHFLVQEKPLGLGHAVWCARKVVGDEPFAIILPDDLVLADIPCLSQMVAAHEKIGGNMVAMLAFRLLFFSSLLRSRRVKALKINPFGIVISFCSFAGLGSLSFLSVILPTSILIVF